MKLISKMIPINLFKSKKSSRSVSRSNPSSFSSNSTNSVGTPTSVLPPGEYSYATQAFKMMDKDGHGKIEKTQLEKLLTKIGRDPPTQQEVRLMLTEIDTDGDGCISLEEFGAIESAFEPAAEGDELKEVFGFFDADRDGKITADELHEVFTALGDEECSLEECRRMVAEVGRSGDGFVCFEDFVTMMEVKR